MRFVYERGFDLEPGTAPGFRQWLMAHDQELRLACPEDVVYLGTYAVVHTTTGDAGDFRLRWGMEQYSAMEALERAMSDPGPMQQLMDQLAQFEPRGGRRDHNRRTLLTSIGCLRTGTAAGASSRRLAS
jgi:hypothetical protein